MSTREEREYIETMDLINDLIKSLDLDTEDVRSLCELSGVEWTDFQDHRKKKVNSIVRVSVSYCSTYQS